MKYVVVKTVTKINFGADAEVHCAVSLHDDMKEAVNKSKRMYSEIVKEYATSGDLVATSYEELLYATHIVKAKIFGHQLVNVIAVNAVNEKKVR